MSWFYIYIYIHTCIYVYIQNQDISLLRSYISVIKLYDSQTVHTNHCFKSFYPEYFADNQIRKITENNIFRLFDILSFTRSSLTYTSGNLQLNIAYFTDFMFN